MKLRKGRPLRRRMMAAMAQQELRAASAATYCNDYSDAIAGRPEARSICAYPAARKPAACWKALNRGTGEGASGCSRSGSRAHLGAADHGRAGRSRDTQYRQHSGPAAF